NLNIAVIGTGGWGKNHVRVLNDLGVLSAVCDSDENRIKSISNKYKIHSYSNLKDLFEKERNLDACLVCTPTKTHYAIASEIIKRKINVFVEKPLSFSSAECEELTKLSKQYDVILTSGYIERFNPAIQDLKRIIEENTCGELLMMEFHRENRMPLHIKDVGIIYDTSVHDIDTALFIFNSKPTVVFARSGRKFHSSEDFSTIMLGFENQKVAIIASNWITPKKVRRFSAVCSEGIITGDFITQEIKIDDENKTLIPRRQFQEPLTLELKNFLQSLTGEITKFLVTPEEATAVTKIAEAALISSNTGAPVYLTY
ncbi:MAG TPA: Gfo/Idh/MocA family oxidoreductase, partial [Candidatus Nitrosocosmicus sp.]|nr:Gfo/Idh/MocA family oxidoreductase [Candidatus Nitrosocosmicus sp.]